MVLMMTQHTHSQTTPVLQMLGEGSENIPSVEILCPKGAFIMLHKLRKSRNFPANFWKCT